MALRERWFPAHIGVGSNLDEPVRQVRDAVTRLDTLAATRVVSRSSLYRNPPMGPPDQPDFVNAVVGLLTRLGPQELLRELLALESASGRERAGAEYWGPRIIDLDLLAYGQRMIDEPELRVPHPGIPERNFVLFPLLEIAPDLVIPGIGIVRELARRSCGSTLQLIHE